MMLAPLTGCAPAVIARAASSEIIAFQPGNNIQLTTRDDDIGIEFDFLDKEDGSLVEIF